MHALISQETNSFYYGAFSWKFFDNNENENEFKIIMLLNDNKKW